jgi:NADH dehydrogenase FAD-containing subunit
LSSFDERLSEYTMRTFKNRKIDVRTEVSVKEVQRHEISKRQHVEFISLIC